MTEVQIVMPRGALGASADDDFLDTAMRVIAVGFGDPEEWSSKYGTNFENDVFMMHRFCWCDRSDCPWCMGCDCPESAHHFLVDGKEVTCTEWMAFYKRETGDNNNVWEGPEYEAYVERCNAANERRSTRHDPVCLYCTEGRFPEKGALKGKPAPHFWFKPSGFRLWWYKYIGRDMEIDGDLTADFMQQIFATHPKGMTAEEAIQELARREEETAKSFAAMFADLGVTLG